MNIQEVKSTKQFPPLFRGLPKEVPFKKGDTVKVDTKNNPNYKLGKEKLIGKPLIVLDCYRSDIGDMSVYILKLESSTEYKVNNPYLAHHFDYYED